MPDSPRSFVILLKFNHDDPKNIAAQIDHDMRYWQKGKGSITYMPVLGEYDVVVRADGGTVQDVATLALSLLATGRYTTTVLTQVTHDEWGEATKAAAAVDSHKR